MKAYVYCLVAFMLGAAVAWGQVDGVSRVRTEVNDGIEVLTRGPVHEAFAETVTFNPEPGIVTPKMPPAAIEELPPEQRPEGTNVAWIPGYWAWDDERTDFLWVSGVWRALPPGRQWVPGYWGRARQGAQWTSGYWADSESTEVEYLPQPPATVEVGANVPAPSANHIWLPGCWVWQQNRYAWRPGYWAVGQSNWDWIPAHYVWSPRGYLFVDGYYDYTVARRGVLFAPVYFNSTIYSQRGFSYSPVTVINPAVFASHLFLRPSYGHYYFGDYYGSNYSSNGFSPWFSFSSSRSGYDPFYAQQHWQHRNDGQWNRQVRADFAHRQDNAAARPPRTYAAQQLGGNDPQSPNMASVIAQQLDQFRKTADSSIRFQPVSDDDRQQFGRRGQEAQLHRQQRQQMEANVVDPTGAPSVQGDAAGRVKLPKSPFVSKRADEFGENQRPPKSHAKPQLDTRLVPTPRPRGNPSAGTNPAPLKVKGAPKAEPKDKPKNEPKAEPKGKPNVEPKAAPKTEPKVEPKAPKVEPRAPKAPKGKPKGKP